MQRRQYLATGALFTSVAVSGCSSPGGEIALGGPTDGTTGSTSYFVYESDGENVLEVGFRKTNLDETSYRLRTIISQRLETSLDEATVRFRPDGDADLYFDPPRRSQRGSFRSSDDDGVTVVEMVEGVSGTTGFDLLVRDDGEETEQFVVSYDITASEEGTFGTTYTTLDTAEVDVGALDSDAE